MTVLARSAVLTIGEAKVNLARRELVLRYHFEEHVGVWDDFNTLLTLRIELLVGVFVGN